MTYAKLTVLISFDFFPIMFVVADQRFVVHSNNEWKWGWSLFTVN